jgi:hypothetical protein
MLLGQSVRGEKRWGEMWCFLSQEVRYYHTHEDLRRIFYKSPSAPSGILQFFIEGVAGVITN